jgi:hypothetical protein
MRSASLFMKSPFIFYVSLQSMYVIYQCLLVDLSILILKHLTY